MKKNAPNPKKEFEKLFWAISDGENASSFFSDFLQIIICTFSHMQMEERYLEIIRRYPKKAHQIQELFRCCLQAYREEIVDEADWSDMLGTFYELHINSASKAQRTGQFFTPKEICTLMAQITHGEDLKGGGKTINDCACGSGRNLLAAHAIAPGNYFFGEDIDPMCVYLTTVNFLLNGVVGEVVCWNSLAPLNSFRFGFKCGITAIGMPIVAHLAMKESFSWRCYQSILAQRNLEATTAPETTPTLTTEKPAKKPPIANNSGKSTANKPPQLTLF